jgi:hypothetical protein
MSLWLRDGEGEGGQDSDSELSTRTWVESMTLGVWPDALTVYFNLNCSECRITHTGVINGRCAFCILIICFDTIPYLRRHLMNSFVVYGTCLALGSLHFSCSIAAEYCY